MTGLEVGESVAVYGPQGCGRCYQCAQGKENYCERAAELGITLVLQAGPDKMRSYQEVLALRHCEDSQVAYMADDLLDLAVLARVGLAAAPSDAATEVRERVHWVSAYPGGRGAVRELVELVLRAQGKWDRIVQMFLTQ